MAPAGARRVEGSTPVLSEREVSTSIGSTAYGTNGDKLGTVEHFYVDDRTGAPTWVAVTTGLFGTKQSIVPAVDATVEASGGLRLPVTADAVKSAPHLTGDHLTPQDEAELRRHYGVGQTGLAQAGVGEPAGPRADVQADEPTQTFASANTTQPVPVDTGGGMVRSEERLVVGTERVATTRARIVKYVVTEEVQITVPIRREEVRVEEVPVDAPDLPGEALVDVGPAGADQPGTAATSALPEEIILHTERPVVTVEVVPVERVRLRTEVVQGQETVTEQVQREQIAVDQHAVPPTTARHAATDDTTV